jgi:hypothetical protein
VQLPTFQSFSTDSSVLVPDHGTASLGGVTRSSTGANQFGPIFFPGNRSLGGQVGTAGVNVSAKIHDFERMDAALLSGTQQVPAQDPLPGMTGAGANGSGPAGPPASVADLAVRKAALDAAGQAEADALLKRGLKAQAEGKSGAAKIYLQMAAKRATGNLKTQILAALANGKPFPAESATSRASQNHGNRSTAAAASPSRN